MWSIDDNGDVPPRGIIKGAGSYLVHPAGVAIDPQAGEVFVTDGVRNGLFTFLVPKLFSKEPSTPEKAAEKGTQRNR